jgi:hypothetical protein
MLSVMFMDHFQLLFFAIILFVIGGFLFARLRYGSWTGAFLEGSVERTYGEVVLKGGFASSQVLRVVGLRGATGREYDALPPIQDPSEGTGGLAYVGRKVSRRVVWK